MIRDNYAKIKSFKLRFSEPPASDLDRAEALFRAAIARDSTLATAHSNLGMIYHGTGRLKAAVERFEAATRHAAISTRCRE